MYLRQILLAQRAVGVVVQAALQTFEAEGVSAGSGHWLIEQSRGKTTKSTQPNVITMHLPTLNIVAIKCLYMSLEGSYIQI